MSKKVFDLTDPTFFATVRLLCQQVRRDIEGVENEILTRDPDNPQKFAPWTTVANTYRWTEEIEKDAAQREYYARHSAAREAAVEAAREE